MAEDVNKNKVNLQNVTKEKNDEISSLKEQLRGSVRRINYLVEEREKLVKEEKEKNAYITKLEMKIVQQNNLKKKASGSNQKTAPNTRSASPFNPKITPQQTVFKTPRTLKFDSMIQSKNLEMEPSFQNQIEFSPISANPTHLKYSQLHSKSKGVLSENKEVLNLKAITDNDELEEKLSSFHTIHYKFEESPDKRGRGINNNEN